MSAKSLAVVKKVKDKLKLHGAIIQILTTQRSGEPDFDNPSYEDEYTKTEQYAKVSTEASESLQKLVDSDNMGVFEYAFKVPADIPITKSNKIEFEGSVYEVLYVSIASYWQQEPIMYEVLARK